MFVLATAGHVDHGKSTLLRALTDQEPDRLPEEKKRGMTIDLNFVWLAIGPTRVGIIDVPGHQKFVRNMIAGLMNVDAYLMVVAADDGWMPQSEEHWEVLKSLGISYGIGVITKSDLVTPERLKEVEQAVRQRLSELGSASTVAFAAGDDNTKAKVLDAISSLLARLPTPRRQGGARLWVDRAFSPKGMGTVVTGTLREGPIHVGQEVMLFPNREKTVVRGIQCYHETKASAQPVTRIAIQLAKVTRAQVPRGTLLAADFSTFTTTELDGQITCFKSLAKKNKTCLALFGTAAVDCKVIPFQALPAKGQGWARLKFSAPVALRVGERLIIRDHGDEGNLAAVVVADVAPSQRLKQTLPLLQKWENTRVSQVGYLLTKWGAVDAEQLSHQMMLSSAELIQTLRELRAQALSDRWFLGRSLVELDRPTIIARLKKELRGSREVLQELLPLVEALKPQVALPGPSAADDQAWQTAKAVLTQASWQPVALKDSRSRLACWVREKKIVSLGEGYYLLQADWERWVKKVLAKVDESGAAKTTDLREALGLSRKQTVLILEKMDSERITYLKDGVRRRLR